MDVGTDASTIPIFVLIRLLLVILMMTPMNWPLILVAVVMTMTGAVIYEAAVRSYAWHMLFFVTWTMAMTVASLRVCVIVIVRRDAPVVMVVIICIARSMVVVIIDWVVEITARVLVIANHAAADRVYKDALIVAESRKIED